MFVVCVWVTHILVRSCSQKVIERGEKKRMGNEGSIISFAMKLSQLWWRKCTNKRQKQYGNAHTHTHTLRIQRRMGRRWRNWEWKRNWYLRNHLKLHSWQSKCWKFLVILASQGMLPVCITCNNYYYSKNYSLCSPVCFVIPTSNKFASVAWIPLHQTSINYVSWTNVSHKCVCFRTNVRLLSVCSNSIRTHIRKQDSDSNFMSHV